MTWVACVPFYVLFRWIAWPRTVALELKAHGVAFVSLWPGAVKTELILQNAEAMKSGGGTAKPACQETLQHGGNAHVWEMFADGESPEYSGKCVVALATGERAGSANLITLSIL